MLRGAGELIEICRRRIHHEPHHRSADGRLLLGGGRVPRRVRERADDPDLEGHLRGSDARDLRAVARRFRAERVSAARPAERSPCVDADHGPDLADGHPVRRATTFRRSAMAPVAERARASEAASPRRCWRNEPGHARRPPVRTSAVSTRPAAPTRLRRGRRAAACRRKSRTRTRAASAIRAQSRTAIPTIRPRGAENARRQGPHLHEPLRAA